MGSERSKAQTSGPTKNDRIDFCEFQARFGQKTTPVVPRWSGAALGTLVGAVVGVPVGYGVRLGFGVGAGVGVAVGAGVVGWGVGAFEGVGVGGIVCERWWSA